MLYNYNGDNMSKEIAIISDIHGNYQALDAIIKDIKKRNIKDIICLGDTIALGPSSRECLDLIIKEKIPMLLGNHEMYHICGHDIDGTFGFFKTRHHKWINKILKDDYKEYLNECKLEKKIKLCGKSISFQHFIFENKNKNPFYPVDIIDSDKIKDIVSNLEDDIVIVGHDHHKKTIEYNNKKLVVVGSSGCVTDDNTFYTILSDKNNRVNIDKIDIKYDRNQFKKIYFKTRFPNYLLYNYMFYKL